MKVMCPFMPGELNPQTEAALKQYAPQTEFVDVSGSKFDYWRAIRERWTGTQDLMIVEQDIILTEDIVPYMIRCDQSWCTYGYMYDRNDPRKSETREIFAYDALGCVRFSAQLQKKHPEALHVAFTPEAEGLIDVPWFLIDWVIAANLRPKVRTCCHGIVEHHQTKRDWSQVGVEAGYATHAMP